MEGLTISFKKAAKTLTLIMTTTPPVTGPTVVPKVTVKPEIAAREAENVVVAHDRGEPRQQATVEQERTMLAPELSRLKGTPSTCVCSVGYKKEKAIMGCVIRAKHEIKPDTCKSSKIPISACLACTCSTKLKVTAEPEIAARESEK